METQKTSCYSQRSNDVVLQKKPSFKSGILSFFTTALIIVLPKCPLCVAAYSSALLLFFDMETLMPVLLHGKPVLGVLIIALIAFNYNPKKSKVALAVSGLALIVLILATYYYLYLVPNWIIYSAFLFAAWYNGNFRYFYSFIVNSKYVKALMHKTN